MPAEYPCFDLRHDFDLLRSMVESHRFDDAMRFIDEIKTIDLKHWRELLVMKDVDDLLCICSNNVGSVSVLYEILEAGADPNKRCTGGNHPLSNIIDCSSPHGLDGVPELRAMLEYGANPNLSGLAGAGLSVLGHAVIRNRLDVVQLLLRFGADPDLDLVGEGSAIDVAGNSQTMLGVLRGNPHPQQ